MPGNHPELGAKLGDFKALSVYFGVFLAVQTAQIAQIDR